MNNVGWRMGSYTTTQGDTWDGIAFRLWGREHLMSALMRANPDHADVLMFPAGVVLVHDELINALVDNLHFFVLLVCE